MSRKEIKFNVNHSKESTPNIQEVKDKLAAMITAKEDLVFIDNIKSKFGSASSFGYAKIYDSEESAKKIEKEHTLKMNQKKEDKDESA